MKITGIKLEGFRSFRTQQSIKLKNGRSLCLLAENGRGKSSLVDALEFWATGDVDWVHREGIGLGALVHLDAGEALVEVAVEGVGVATRRLKGSKPGPLTPGAGPLDAEYAPGAIPILRYRTMANFVHKSANDKRAELLDLLGLESLASFRLGIRRLARAARKRAGDADRQVSAARNAWATELDGRSIQEILGNLSVAAKLAEPLTSADQLGMWELPRSPNGTSDPRAVSVLATSQEVVQAATAIHQVDSSRWNKTVSDSRIAEQRGLSVLLEAGRQMLASWENDSCPLCLQDKDKDALDEELERRSAELVIADEAFRGAQEELQTYLDGVIRLGRALTAMVDGPQPIVWPAREDLERCRDALRGHVDAVRAAMRQRSPIDSTPEIPSQEVLDKVQAAALAAPADVGPALLQLAKLKGLLKAMRLAEQQLVAAATADEAMAAAAEIGEEVVEEAITAALDALNKSLASYYADLVGAEVYSDVRLDYKSEGVGGIEFAFTWDDRHPVRPPQRVMSESQLNALGLALFLARLKLEGGEWQTMALDDVVTSFDAIHRTRLVRLLDREFSNWQVILCTHDPHLSRSVEMEGSLWRHEKVTTWTAKDGSILGDAMPLQRLKQRLDSGEAADEQGGLARLAIERALEKPVRKLGLRIRHDPTNTYSADDYRRTLVRGLGEGGFQHADAPVLKRLADDASITNRACHFKEVEPSVTTADLRLLIEDIAELEALFRCDRCNGIVWDVNDVTAHRCQCSCGKLTCA